MRAVSATAGRWRRVVALIVAFVTAVAVVGCSSGDDDGGSNETRKFTAANGTFDIPAQPKRVVALSRAVPALLAVGANVVGVSDYDEEAFDEEDLETYKGLPKVGTVNNELNYEAIAATKPDLIISGIPQRMFEKMDTERLTSIAPTLGLGPLVPSEWKEYGEKMADAVGKASEFDAMREQYDERAKQIKEANADKIDGKRFAAIDVASSTAAGNFYREYNDSWTTNIAQNAGLDFPGKSATRDDGTFRDSFALERLTDLNDFDAILYPVNAAGKPDPELDSVLNSTLWKSLDPVREGRLLPVSYTLAETYPVAIESLESLDAALQKLPAR